MEKFRHKNNDGEFLVDEYKFADVGCFGDIYLTKNDKKIGSATYESYKRFRKQGDLLLFNTSVINLYDVEIKNEFRCKGYGEKLLRKIIFFAKKYNFKYIKLDVEIDNDAAVRLYQKVNFNIHKTNLYNKTFTMLYEN